ncbi:MAG: hypothetical protein Q8O22_08070 [Candidatus Omnitrophota bacterium]|nr:hypothetical protein [Candidatus Omnitrophota bacterium]
MKKTALHLLVIMAFGIIAYAGSFSNEFLYDDEYCVQRNPYIKDLRHIKEIFTKNFAAGAYRVDNFYRPLHQLAYLIVYQIFGLNVFGYHLLNFTLHLINAFLLYFFTLTLFKKRAMSFIASLLFLVHPIHTEAITYISNTGDPLIMFFGLLTLIFYLKTDKNLLWYFPSLACFVAALLSKETIVILPFLIVLADLYRGELSIRRSAKYIPFFLVMGCYILARLTVFNFSNSLNLFKMGNIYTQNLHYRIFTFFASLLEYYKLLLFPVGFKFDRSMTVFASFFLPQVMISFVLFLVFFYFACRDFKKDKIIFLGFMWFFISLAPVSGIIPVTGFTMEHWLYFPSIGFFMVISFFLAKLKTNINIPFHKNRELSVKLYIPVLLVIAAIFTYLTIQRNKDWKEPITFYNKIIKHNPGLARVRHNLAMAYGNLGLFDMAEKQYKTAIYLEDNYAETHYNLALLYIEKDMIPEAVSELNKAIAINDNFIYAHITLKEIYEKFSMTDEAQRESDKINGIISN